MLKVNNTLKLNVSEIPSVFKILQDGSACKTSFTFTQKASFTSAHFFSSLNPRTSSPMGYILMSCPGYKITQNNLKKKKLIFKE